MDGNEKLYDFKRRSDESGLCCEDPSLTVQAQAEDADINVIVRRFGLTGKLPETIRLPEYQDYDDVFDFHSAQLALLQANKDFMALPADVRKEFDNDPGVFFNIASNPDNYDYLADLGLAKKREVLDTVVPPAPPAPDGK